MSRADSKTPRRIDNADGTHDVREIGERLTHSHENNVVDLLAGGCFQRDELIDNFDRLEIARPALEPACTRIYSRMRNRLAWIRKSSADRTGPP